MAPINDTHLNALEAYLQHYPGIRLYTAQSPAYNDLTEYFVIRPARPFAVARPQNATDVQALIRFCLQHYVDLIVRSGGHDCAGRSQIYNGLSIDMRDIHYVEVSKDRSVARVGGGIQLGRLSEVLGESDLVTPTYVPFCT
jgi:FAD/FMN-containing dehydrogenase